MNKSSLFIACSVLTCGIAHAQSAVTIYGILDASIANDRGRMANGALNSVVSGGQAGTRIGFKGTEDLGSGLSALFALESGVNIDDGALSQGSGVLFGRKALVGLQGAFGTVKVGRQDSAIYVSTVNYDPFMEGITGAYTRIMTNISTLRRNDNTIDYTTPAIAGLKGFKAEAAWTLGEVAGDTRSGRGFSGSATYAAGPFSVALSHQQVNSKPVAPAAIVTTKLTALGASYDAKIVKLYALVSTNKVDAPARADGRDALVGLSIPFGASAVQASYIRHRDSAVTAGGARQLALGYTYALSKRTNLYARYGHITNERNARFGLAALSAGGSPSGSTDKLFSAGICELF